MKLELTEGMFSQRDRRSCRLHTLSWEWRLDDKYSGFRTTKFIYKHKLA